MGGNKGLKEINLTTQVQIEHDSLSVTSGYKPEMEWAQPVKTYIQIKSSIPFWGASQVVLVVKNPPANAGDIRDAGLIPGSGRSPGGGRGSPLQCSCLENPMDRGAWWATVHWVIKNWT